MFKQRTAVGLILFEYTVANKDGGELTVDRVTTQGARRHVTPFHVIFVLD